jgi:hypothetical protein
VCVLTAVPAAIHNLKPALPALTDPRTARTVSNQIHAIIFIQFWGCGKAGSTMDNLSFNHKGCDITIFQGNYKLARIDEEPYNETYWKELQGNPKMTLPGWIISLCALVWLGILWFYKRSQRNPLGLVWLLLPLIFTAAFQLLSKQSPLAAAAAGVVLLVAERRHLQSKLLEWMILIVGILAIGWMLFTTPLNTAFGIVGILVFWFSWELRAIDSETAIILMTCQVLWPGMEFVFACIVVFLGWALIVRIREGGWLRAHAVQGCLW